MEETAAKKRRRAPNWSQEQVLLLAQKILERRDIIKGKFSPTVTYQAKHEAWAEVAHHVSASFPLMPRTPTDCENRFFKLQKDARDEISEYKKGIVATGMRH